MLKKSCLLVTLLAMILCGNVYSENDAPQGQPPTDPIPPVNIEKTKEPESAIQPEPAPQPSASAVDKMGKPSIPKKLEMDTNYDGRVDRIEVYDSEGRTQRLDVDTNGDGIFDEWMVFEKGKPKMKGKDRNGDGRTDTWIEY